VKASHSARLVIHGGAGRIHVGNANESVSRAALQAALHAGWDLLSRGGSALDAVQAAVLVMEDSGAFSAGKGAVQDSEGQVTLDAALMNGVDQRAGAVAAVPWLRNPITAARMVMERTPHVLLVGTGAESFLLSQGVGRQDAGYFRPAHNAEAKQGTVGAVALDEAGNLAAATSTGGTPAKLPGRVGDSPLIGAGTFANEACAVSATGQGEFFIRTVFAYRVTAAIQQGASVQDAAESALQDVARLGGEGGAIAITAKGEWATPFITPGMFRGRVDAHGSRVAIFANEFLT
jgi:L-asparaginase / beta-aspartyl-peptidase